jgi:hypothetical protein
MARILFISLISAIVMGLLPMTHPMFSMQTTLRDEMAISHQDKMDHGSAGDKSSGSCCDEIAQFSVGCSFLVPQYACLDSSGGSKQVVNSSPVVQSIYIETVTPPPKA